MKALNDVYKQTSKVIHSSQFINEDQPEKDGYKQAIKMLRQSFIKQTNPEMDPTVINNLTHQLENAQTISMVIKNLLKQTKCCRHNKWFNTFK